MSGTGGYVKTTVLFLLLIGLASFWWWLPKIHHSSDPTAVKSATFDKERYSVDQADSLWAVVDKGRALPADYAPNDLVLPHVKRRDSTISENTHLRAIAANDLQKLFRAAKQAGSPLMLTSGYRSYATQQKVYDDLVSSSGTQAEQISAKPGYSEHQTGLAADVEPVSGQCELDKCFGATPTGQWLAANAYHYGYIIRYPADKVKLTGYDYEPWHIRYVGSDLAQQLQQSGQTMEQFFGLPTYRDYPDHVTQLQSAAALP